MFKHFVILDYHYYCRRRKVRFAKLLYFFLQNYSSLIESWKIRNHSSAHDDDDDDDDEFISKVLNSALLTERETMLWYFRKFFTRWSQTCKFLEITPYQFTGSQIHFANVQDADPVYDNNNQKRTYFFLRYTIEKALHALFALYNRERSSHFNFSIFLRGVIACRKIAGRIYRTIRITCTLTYIHMYTYTVVPDNFREIVLQIDLVWRATHVDFRQRLFHFCARAVKILDASGRSILTAK